MVNNLQAQIVVFIVEKLIYIFSISSILLLLLFFIIKLSILHKNKIPHKIKIYKNASDLEYIEYGKYLGQKMLYTSKSRSKIRQKIQESNIYETLEKIYYKHSLYEYRLFVFSSIAFLGDDRVDKIAYDIINDKKIRNYVPEFITLALLSLAIKINNHKKLYKFYNLLIEIDKKEHITHNLAEFLFINSFNSLKELNRELVIFIDKYKFLSNHNCITHGFIDALYSIPSNKLIYNKIKEQLPLYKKDYTTLKLVVKLGKYWDLKCPNIESNYKVHNNLSAA